ncbi:MAG: nucleoside deaminase [Bacteroidales bacterium]|nr:nucleoside deaminase [Bacteroidales bacterium]
MEHEKFMRMALLEAQKAADAGEVPVGAVIVCKNRLIARAHNQTEMLNDVTAHAEILAITAAANSLGAKYLSNCTIYVTLEPCAMCAGALSWAQISTIVYGAGDIKKGYTSYSEKILHPKTTVIKGVLADESEKIIKDFFEKKRKQDRQI